MMRNPQTENRVVAAIAPASYGTGATNGTGFSRKGFDTALAVLKTGVLGTAATLDVKFQECDTVGGTYADITGAAFSQKVKASDDNLVYVGELDLRGRKKFLRAVSTVGAAASIFDVTVILGNPDRSEAVYAAQGGSEAKAAPVLSGTGASTKYEFSV